MARTSSGKTGSKRKRAGVRGSKARSAAVNKAPPKSRALRVKNDPVRKQDLQSSPVQSDGRRDDAELLSPGLEWIGLMSRTVSASLSLPIGMTRCVTPLEVWGEQSRFVQSIALDCRSVALRMMSAAIGAQPLPDPAAPSKRRKRAAAARADMPGS